MKMNRARQNYWYGSFHWGVYEKAKHGPTKLTLYEFEKDARRTLKFALLNSESCSLIKLNEIAGFTATVMVCSVETKKLLELKTDEELRREG